MEKLSITEKIEELKQKLALLGNIHEGQNIHLN